MRAATAPHIVEDGRCPHCGREVVLDFDTDGENVWLHEVFRGCSCPMPEHVNGYRVGSLPIWDGKASAGGTYERGG